MNVWLITIGEPLPSDSQSARLLRTGILARRLADRDHEVTWWSSTFDHSAKKQRYREDTALQINDNYRLQLIHGPGYQKNASLQRLKDHRVVACGFQRLARRRAAPDVILCSLPTVELSLAAVEYGESHDVPVALDIRDMWPDIFADLAPKWCRGLARLGLTSMDRECRRACSGASAITGHTPGFVEWGLDKARRSRGTLDRDFAFGYIEKTPSASEQVRAAEFWNNRKVVGDNGQSVVCFFGAIGKQFRLESVIRAARRLAVAHARNVLFVICGAGDRLNYFRQMASGCPNVLFPGWIERPEIWELMRRSCLALAPYRDSRDFQLSIPNKAIEYLSGGLPILTSLPQGVLLDLLTEHGCGLSYGGDAQRLAAALADLLDSPSRLNEMSASASRLFHDRFTGARVYSEMADYLEQIAATRFERTESQRA